MADATVDATWIAAHLDDPHLRIVEVDVSRAAYEQGHIPGAVFWNAYTDLRDGAYQPVPRSTLAALVARTGIGSDTTVVVYGYGAALGFWLLNAYGHEHVHVLDGARDRWAQAGQPWSTDTPSPQPADEGPTVRRDDIFATRAVAESAIGDPTRILLDVRSPLEYSGGRFWPSGATEGAGRSGHIPGAVSVPIDLLRADGGALRSASELQQVFDDAGVSKDKTVITYCTIGNRASHAWYALKYVLGYPNVQVYYGSWVDWGKSPDTPIEN